MKHKQSKSFSALAIYIIITGWLGFAVYTFIFFFMLNDGNGESFVKHFLSLEHQGIRFRALVFCVPLLSMLVGYLINEREKLFRKALDSQKKYLDLFENANDPIFILDKDMKFTDVNKKAVEMLGYLNDEIIDMSMSDIIPKEVSSEVVGTNMAEVRGHSERFISKIQTADGQWLDVEISSSAIIEDGNIVGYREIVRDVTDLKRMQEELHGAYIELEERVVDKSFKLIETRKRLQSEIIKREQSEATLNARIRELSDN
jgi:PAS domain S-box-containing protein